MPRARRVKSSQPLLAAAAALLGCAAAGTAQAACTYTYGSLSSTLPNLGNVVSGTVGKTTFRIEASASGTITQLDGDGVRLSAGGSPVSITIATNSHSHCSSSTISGTLTATGSTSGRAKNMGNFDVAGGAGVSLSGESGTSTRTFTIAPLGKSVTRTLYLGMDFGIKGDDEGGATATTNGSQASYILTLTPSNGNGVSRTGTGVATVRRSLRLTKNSDLKFGRIVRPSSGTSTISVSPITGLRSVTGTAVGLAEPAASWASYTVNGEGGQTISISIPATVSMTGPGGGVTVNLTSFKPPPQQLSGSPNSDGVYDFWVGGNFTLDSTAVSGAYSGAFNVTVAYN